MSRPPLTLGIIPNPASGRDLRRLTANAGLFSSTDKASVVQRLLGAFGATGVERNDVNTSHRIATVDLYGFAECLPEITGNRELNARLIICGCKPCDCDTVSPG